MKVIYFSRDYTPHDHRFLNALAQTPNQVYFLRLERRGHALEDRAIPENIRLVSWIGGSKPANFRDGFRLLSSLHQVIHNISPDVIHAGPIQSAAFLTALTGFNNLVSMSWGYDLLRDADRNTVWRWATRFTLRRSSVLVGDCQAVLKQAIKFGIHQNRVVLFPWGVDLIHFSPRQSLPSTAEPFTLLSTRSWEPIYGVDVLAHAFVLAARQCPNLRLVMTGQGSMASHLFQIFERAGVTEKVYFPGHVNYAELPGYYHSASLYLSASHSDGSSISLLEAMACGIPVLVSDIPGNQEWIEQEVQGWLFPDGDVNAMAQAILTAVNRRKELVTMGAAARRRAEERADWKKNFPRLLDAYAMAYSN